MKRLIIACLTLTMAVGGHAQQNIGQTITVHMKDGSKVVYKGGTKMGIGLMGNYETETISNFPNQGSEPTVTKTLQMGEVEFWPYYEPYLKVERQAPGQYSVKMSVNATFEPNNISGVCIGTASNPTWDGEDAWKRQEGDMEPCIFGKKPSQLSLDEEDTWCDYPLELGKTYYVRPFAALYYNKDPQDPDVANRVYHTTFYGEEQNFRVPDCIGDHYWVYDEIRGSYHAEFFPNDTVATHAAWEVFSTQHAGEVLDAINANPRFYLPLGALFNEFKATEAGASMTVRAETYDDGTVYFVDQVPDAFYDYVEAYYQQENTICERVYQHLIDYVNTVTNSSGSVYTRNVPLPLNQIENVDASWNIPGDSYLYVTPINSTAQPYVGFELPHFVPGKYKILITMAPETTVENNEENASLFIPSKFRINLFEPSVDDAYYPSAPTLTFTDTEGNKDFVNPADQVSTIELEHEFTASCAILQLQSYVLTREQRAYIYTRNLRIAEIRLVPIVE